MVARSLRVAVSVLPLLVACGSDDERLGWGVQADTVTVCPPGEVLEGVDVSHWDDTIDWSQVAASGISFAFVKATEQTSYVDPTLDDNWNGIQQQGLVGGAYHFFHADIDPIAQADHFLDTIQGLTGNVLPVLDLETDNGQSESAIAAGALAWLEHVAAQTGKTPIVYTSSAFLSDFSSLSPYILWVANWQVACPKVPDAWSTWTFWQTSDQGSVPGIPTAVDMNKFNGSLADLQALTGMGSSSASTGATGSTSSSAASGGGAGTTGVGGAGSTGAGGDTGTATASGGDTGAAGPSVSAGVGAANGVKEGEPEADGGCSTSPGAAGTGTGLWLALLALLAARAPGLTGATWRRTRAR